jgi:hypothetical protein
MTLMMGRKGIKPFHPSIHNLASELESYIVMADAEQANMEPVNISSLPQGCPSPP